MGSFKISEVAAELGYSNKEIIQRANEMGFANIKTANSSVSVEEAEAIYKYVQTGELPINKNKVTTSSNKEISTKNSNSESKEEKAIKKPKEKVVIEEPVVEVEKPIEKESVKQETILENEPLSTASFKKRRGLVIVNKKKKPEEPPKIEKIKVEKLNIGLEEIFSNSEQNLKKKKKEKKQIHTSKKESAEKIEILSNASFADSVMDDEENIVVLPDLTVKPIQVENKNKTKKQLNIYKTSQNKAYGNFESGIGRNSRKKRRKVIKAKDNEVVSIVNIPKEIRLYEFADKINKQPSEIISKLFLLGMMTTKNDFLDEDVLEILADEFKVEINIIDEAQEFDYVQAYEQEEDEQTITRAPVITIMGHVDHGKTSLLDYIQKSHVVHGEAGGITQHVGAYMVEKNGRKITFIDTPGHEAFSSMRARGAEVTDIVIIVVAADDGVKPQTKEAVTHAKAADVPIIVAINKMDKESANPDLIKIGLSELEIVPTEWGGDYEFVPISAKTGMGVEELLEIVLLQADLLDLQANPNRDAKATIIESSIQKGRGPVATVIVQNGTLKVGDTVVAGVAYGKIKALVDNKGQKLEKILPGECGVIIGLSEVPDAGETLISVKSDKEAREYANKKYDYLRQKELSKSTKVALEELSAKIAEGELKTLPVIVKADVQGSLEVINSSLEKLRNNEIKVNVISSGVGGITQSDIALASASENSIILGFNIRPTGDIKEKAKEQKVEIKTYSVIYNLIDDVKSVLSGLMSPIISEEELGQAEVRQVINVPKLGQIAGCIVTDGSIQRGAKIRVIRNGVIIFEGNVGSLKRFKDDVKEVAKGYECGVGIEGYNDMQIGDFIESYKEKESQAVL